MNGKLHRAIDAALTSAKPLRPLVFAPTLHEWPGNDDFLSKPWLRWETRKSIVGGREVQHLHHLRELAIVKLGNSSPQDILKYDLAEMNLICAYGLSGKHDIEIESMLKTIDSWVARVAEQTSRRIGLFRQNNGKMRTLAEFRITAMVHVLTSEFNLHYSPERAIDPDNWENPEDSFIHGPLGPRRTGTCTNLPVLLTAVGRRLGYPLKLVLAPRHCFCRWDSPEERFNIEYQHGGLNSHPDKHYREWPKAWPPELIEAERKQPTYLISLTPQQELAYCIHERAHHLDVFGRVREAFATMQQAYRLWPCQRTALWTTHLATKAHNPDRKFPNKPSEETVGKAARDRLIQTGALVILPESMRPQ